MNMKKKKVKTKKPKKVQPKENKTDPYGLVKSFMKMSDFLFGKGWNTNKLCHYTNTIIKKQKKYLQSIFQSKIEKNL